MAYVIGSQKGKDQAKKMKAGEKWVNTTDGSTWEKKSDGSVSVTHNGQTYNNAYKPSVASSISRGDSSGGNSQYTGSSSSIITNNSTQQAIKDKMNANSIAWWSADEAGKEQLAAANKELAALLGGSVSYNDGTGTWSGAAGGEAGISKDDILGWIEEYGQNNQKPTEPQRDPRIDTMLNEILNRDDFSYDAMSDPLYQQYANMYRREGDRAMKETMAEAAAGAGGMNTYAITAAQQANSYYNSQLNDKIPQLYQLAYEMYLQDKESKVQDLGLLQAMDNTQYNRYRDTMNDYYEDRSFAYGNYKDAVNQGNWQANFDYNSMWDNNYFNNENFWKNKEFDYEDMWANKKYTDNRADIEYERNQAEEEEAQATIDWLIKKGVTTIDPAIIEKAGLDEATVKQMITYYQQQNAPKVTPSKVYIDDDDDEPKVDPKKAKEEEEEEDDGGSTITYEEAAKAGENLPTALPITQTAGTFQTLVNDCEQLLKTGGKSAVLEYLADISESGAIDSRLYAILLNKYGK